jgi:hypothetical protein
MGPRKPRLTSGSYRTRHCLGLANLRRVTGTSHLRWMLADPNSRPPIEPRWLFRTEPSPHPKNFCLGLLSPSRHVSGGGGTCRNVLIGKGFEGRWYRPDTSGTDEHQAECGQDVVSPPAVGCPRASADRVRDTDCTIRADCGRSQKWAVPPGNRCYGGDL